MRQKLTYVAFVVTLVVAFTAVANYHSRPLQVQAAAASNGA